MAARHCRTSSSFLLYQCVFAAVFSHKIMQLDGNTNFTRHLPANLPPFPQRLRDNMAALLGKFSQDQSCSLQRHADTEVQPSIHPGVAPMFEPWSVFPCAAASQPVCTPLPHPRRAPLLLNPFALHLLIHAVRRCFSTLLHSTPSSTLMCRNLRPPNCSNHAGRCISRPVAEDHSV